MASQKLISPEMVKPNGRPVGVTEHSLCRAVPSGTGIVVLVTLISKSPETPILANALHKLQHFHPILRSRLRSDTNTNSFSFLTSPTPFIKLKAFDLSSTFKILEKPLNPHNQSISPLQLILEHELNQNSWCNHSDNIQDVFFATSYALPNGKWALVLRLHPSACDRTTAVSLLKQLVMLVCEEERGTARMEIANKGDQAAACLSIEDLSPRKKAKKGLWQLNDKIGCKSRGIKLCGALASAGLIAAHNSRSRLDKQRKYAVVTLTDCRSDLHPPLSDHHFGFYHSFVFNTYVSKGGEKLWELAEKTYKTFASYKNFKRHFTDLAALNFLMCKGIQNPGLTPSSSLRTALLSVFEESVTDDYTDLQKEIGVEDYMGCASAHGIGPSIEIFDTIRSDGRLDCIWVYPLPVRSREQMQEFIDNMKSVLVEGCKSAKK